MFHSYTAKIGAKPSVSLADGTSIKKTFVYFNKALSFYSHFVHIFTVYYKRSRKDAPFYFRLQSPSPKGCRHPFPFWKKKQTTTYILVYHSNIPSPLQEKQPRRTAFSVSMQSLASAKKSNPYTCICGCFFHCRYLASATSKKYEVFLR